MTKKTVDDDNAVAHAEERIVAENDNKGWLYTTITLAILIAGIVYIVVK
jgi:hypothetical protein